MSREVSPTRVLDPLADEPVEQVVAVPGTIDPHQSAFPRSLVSQAVRQLSEGYAGGR